MNVTVISGADLGPREAAAWSGIVDADPRLSSPFLRPEFSQAVAASRDDALIGIVERDGRPIGFFPFQRGPFRIGEPIGGALNDLQGFAVRREASWDPGYLLRGCGLAAWSAPRLLAFQEPFQPFHVSRHDSAFIDLAGGFESYLEAKRRAGTRFERVQKLGQKAARLAADVGPLRFELHSRDSHAVASVLRWRYERYASRGYRNLYAIPWARALYHRVVETQHPHFAGVVSTLRAGDALVAVHLGVRSRDEWHSWVCGYDPRFARYSPGLLLFLRMAEHAGELGVRRIELGGGGYPYKELLANRVEPLAEAIVDPLGLAASVATWRRAGAARIRASRLLHPPARLVNRAVNRVLQRCP